MQIYGIKSIISNFFLGFFYKLSPKQALCTIFIANSIKNILGNLSILFIFVQIIFQTLTVLKEYMKRSTIEDAMFPGCPVRNILARLCDKWTLLVIYILFRSGEQSMRFMELKQQMPDISQRMLTMTLRTLEEDGYVTRTVFPEIPPRVEYALTERAKSLKPILDSLLLWSVDNMDDIMNDRKRASEAR